MPMTPEQAYVEVVKEVASAICQLGSVPSGELYARSCMSFMSVDAYQRVIDVLKQAGVVTEQYHLLTWVGPKEVRR